MYCYIILKQMYCYVTCVECKLFVLQLDDKEEFTPYQPTADQVDSLNRKMEQRDLLHDDVSV